jgi:hypothetical protein
MAIKKKTQAEMKAKLAAAKSFRAESSEPLQLLHAFALNDSSGGAAAAGGCSASQKAFAINRCAQYTVNQDFLLRTPHDAATPIDWGNMSATEIDLHLGHLNFNGAAAPSGLGFGACALKWSDITREQMRASSTRGQLWSAVKGKYS